jgi:hypothetical protein
MEKKTSLLSHAITTAVTESLENMVFMAVEPMHLIWGKVQILKPYNGSITLAFPEQLVRELTHELYAQDGESADNRMINMDTVAEMTNIVAGCMMNMLVSEDEDYELSLPKTGAGDIEYERSSCYIRHFEINGHMYAVMIEGDGLLQFRSRYISLDPTPAQDGWGA